MARGNENWEYLPDGKVKDKKTGAVGVIRMVGGRRVFIKDGQSLSEAMIQSGKFKGQKTKPGMRESFRKAKEEDEKEEWDLLDKYKQTESDEDWEKYSNKGAENLRNYAKTTEETEKERRQLIDELRETLSKEDYDKLIDTTAKTEISNDALRRYLNENKPSLRGQYRQDKEMNKINEQIGRELEAVSQYAKEDGLDKLADINKNASNYAKSQIKNKDADDYLNQSGQKYDYANETDKEKRLKNVFLMDRVLRGMNNEDAVDDGWLFYVEDGATDEGYKDFKKYNEDNEVYVSDEDYNRIVNMYKDRVKEYAEDGIIGRDFYEDRDGNWKEYAGLDDEELDFLANDVDDFKIYGKGDRKTTYKEHKGSNKEAGQKDPYDDPESEESQRLMDIQSKYDNYLQATEGRGASYGELAHIQGLRGKDLDDFEKELDNYEYPDEDIKEYDDGDTDWRAEEEADADERFENRYMNGGNGYTSDNKKEDTGDWREQIKKNNDQLEKDLENYKKTHDMSRGENDDYYELFRENERRNAKIKQEKPDEPYEPVEAYAGYHDKQMKLSGSSINEDGSMNYGNKSWTGKEYTNDEFMEHLTDSNWHHERQMLEEAGLTNQELSYIKDKTKLSQWSVGEELTGTNNVQKMIDEAKAKFRGSKTPNQTMNDAIREKASKGKKIPSNLSKDIYNLDVDKGNAWSGNGVQKTSNGDEIVRVRRNGQSQNSAEDIKNSIEKKYPHLEGKVVNDGEVQFSVRKDKSPIEHEHPASSGVSEGDKALGTYIGPSGTKMRIVSKDAKGNYNIIEMGNRYTANEKELQSIIKDGEYSKMASEEKKPYDVDMSDTTTEEYNKRSRETGFPRSDEHGNYRMEKNGDYTYKMYDKVIDPFGPGVSKNEQVEISDLKRKAEQTLPKEDIDTHAGDLYIKKTDKSTALINNLKNKNNGLISTFKDQQTGETWYDIPFANWGDDYKEKTPNQTMNDAIREGAKKSTPIKVKGDSNVIPRNFTEGTINFKREGDTKTEQYTIKKDEFGRYIGTDASGKEYLFPVGILRNHNVVEFVSPNKSMNDAIREKATRRKK